MTVRKMIILTVTLASLAGAARADAPVLSDSGGHIRLWEYRGFPNGYGAVGAPYPSVGACQDAIKTRAGNGYIYSCGPRSDSALVEQAERMHPPPPPRSQPAAPSQQGRIPYTYTGGYPTIILLTCTEVTQDNGNIVRSCRAGSVGYYSEGDCLAMRNVILSHPQPTGGGRLRMIYECIRPLPNYEVVR